jgi:sphinganine-1-phosphate aldolase
MDLLNSQSLAKLQPLFALTDALHLRFGTSYDRAKTLLFVYVSVTYGLKSFRHLRARGTVATIKEGWEWLAQVGFVAFTWHLHVPIIASQRVLLVVLTLPPMASKVEPQMSKARRDIEDKLVPSGPRVTRYLSLPAEGQTKEWILEEMAKMDDYCHKSDASGKKVVDWKDGKLSGAVYREHYLFLVDNHIHYVLRWWRGHDFFDCSRIRALLCF